MERTRQFERDLSLKIVYADRNTIEDKPQYGPPGNPVIALAEVYQGSTLVARYFGPGANRKCKKVIRWLTCDTPSLWYLQHMTH